MENAEFGETIEVETGVPFTIPYHPDAKLMQETYQDIDSIVVQVTRANITGLGTGSIHLRRDPDLFDQKTGRKFLVPTGQVRVAYLTDGRKSKIDEESVPLSIEAHLSLENPEEADDIRMEIRYGDTVLVSGGEEGVGYAPDLPDWYPDISFTGWDDPKTRRYGEVVVPDSPDVFSKLEFTIRRGGNQEDRQQLPRIGDDPFGFY